MDIFQTKYAACIKTPYNDKLMCSELLSSWQEANNYLDKKYKEAGLRSIIKINNLWPKMTKSSGLLRRPNFIIPYILKYKLNPPVFVTKFRHFKH